MLNSLPLQKCNFWKRPHSLKLLHVYANYKAELSCTGVKKQKIWKEIADEVRQKCSLNCNELQCSEQIEQLRLQYERFKSKDTTSWKMESFLAVAKIAFETTENPVIIPAEVSSNLSVQKREGNMGEHRNWYTCDPVVSWDKEDFKKKQTIKEEKVDLPSDVTTPFISAFNMTTTVPGSSTTNSIASATQSNSSDDVKKVEDFKNIFPPANASTQKWTKAKERILLQVFAKYKVEFSCTELKEETVWRKIVKEVRVKTSLDCDELECRYKIDNHRCGYNKIKFSRKMAKALDRRRKLFETFENPVTFSSEHSSNIPLRACGKRNRKYHFALLQAYSKYKTELNSPDIKEEKVWEKIAGEMREVFFYNCGPSLCQKDLSLMNHQYESFKQNRKTGGLPYYLDEARLAFETDVNLEKTFTVRVDNLTTRVTEHDLQELFEHFGPIDGIYTTKDKLGLCKGSGYITFYRQEDAYQAISAVHGYKYDDSFLKVGWLEFS